MKSHFAFSVQGESHKRKENEFENFSIGKKFPCQDKSFSGELISNDKINFDFLCISDGHGGDAYFRSEKGGEFAILVFKDILNRNMTRILELVHQNQGEKIKNQLAISISKRWREKIQEDLKINPITDFEFSYLQKTNLQAVEKYKTGEDLNAIYGCTLIGYFSVEKFWFALQIGDGDFSLSYDGVNFEFPMPEDENCFLNQTTSLCDDNAVKEFRFCMGNQIPKTVFCSSDGVSNSFKTKQQFINFYYSVFDLFNWSEFSRCQKLQCENPQICIPKCKENLALDEIKNYLPILSRKGSGDDISLAGVVYFEEEIAQSIKDFNRGFRLFKNGQKSEGKRLLENSAKKGNAKAWFRLGEIFFSESEIALKISERILKLEKSEKCFEQAKILGLLNSEDKIQNIKDILLKIDTENTNLDIKISNQIKDFIKPVKVSFDEKIEKLENEISVALNNQKEMSEVEK